MAFLILDDDATVRQAIALCLDEQGPILQAATVAEARKHMESAEIELAIIDINLGNPDIDGVDFLMDFKKRFPELPAIIQSGYRDVSTVVRCIKLGADDYIEKPFDAGTIQLKVQKVLADAKKGRVFRRAFEKSQASNEIIGSSQGLARAKQMVERAAGLRILFYGETGVGKTPFATYSNQVTSTLEEQVRPFEQVNCSALNREQFQDLLFGHKKGAFTGAISDKRGLVEIAHGGDLFLDEIGEMPLDTQALFLTFLDSMEFYRLGDDKKRKAEVRILSATNRNLKKMVEEGKFRRDLYSRISQVVVDIPPLRERKDDIPLLVSHFVEKYAGYKKPIDDEILDIFQRYSWEEGNVRELRDAIEYLCLMSRDSDRITVDKLEDKYRPLGTSVPAVDSSLGSGAAREALDSYGLEAYLNQIEKSILEDYLKRAPDSVDSLARRLKLSRPTLYRRLSKYNISAPRFSN